MRGRARSIAEVLRSLATSDGLYQAVRLEDESYALIRGGNPVHKGDVLPFEPGDGAEIHPYAERRDLEADWAAAMDDIENSDMMLEGRARIRPTSRQPTTEPGPLGPLPGPTITGSIVRGGKSRDPAR